MRRRLLNGGRPVRRPPVIPYNPVHKARCPHCHSLDTIYVPAIAEGHCNACGRSWRFLADPDAGFEKPTIKPKIMDYRDLLGFCIAMRRLKVRYQEARRRFDNLNIVSPAEETWERAWRESSDLA
jgi:ribosomal protein S27E